MVRKMNEEDHEYLEFDELPSVRPCLRTSVHDAETKGLYEYGILSPYFYYIIQNGMINTCINRSSFTATRLKIRGILAKMKVLSPRVEYLCAPMVENA
jgi:hypothetical protein